MYAAVEVFTFLLASGMTVAVFISVPLMLLIRAVFS